VETRRFSRLPTLKCALRAMASNIQEASNIQDASNIEGGFQHASAPIQEAAFPPLLKKSPSVEKELFQARNAAAPVPAAASAAAFEKIEAATEAGRKMAAEKMELLMDRATVVKASALKVATDKRVQVTVGSAVGGAATMGAGGAVTGLVTGGAVGAALGVVPALFTFGLSIPVFAAIGSACGAATGAVAGGSAGLLGGGAAGYGIYTWREEIGTSVNHAVSKVDGAAKYVKETASTSAGFVRARLSGATGGTRD